MNTLPHTDAQQQYKYFAFISYSSKDMAWGRQLQHKLERYRLPARLASKRKGAPNRAYPIFRDETDLSGFKVRDALERELDDSRFLIVICSPQSAQSVWVNDEIQYFIDHGWEDRILPFIVEGTPYSADPATESFPPALRNMSEDPLGVDATALGKRKAFLRLISALLDVKFDELLRRDTARRMRSSIALGFAGLLAAAALGFGIWYNTEHSKLYNAVIYQNEIPVGLYPLSKEEYARANDSYRITTRRGKVVRLENVNSLGTVKEPDITSSTTDYPIAEYLYDDSGELITIVQKDKTGKEMLRKDLTYNKETREIAIDFHSPTNSLNVQALSADMTTAAINDQDSNDRSEITRQRNIYDENGFLIRALYQRDNLGTPACDSNVVYGKEYQYNQLGQVVRISNLDERGQVFNCKYGWAYEEFAYDDQGNEIRYHVLDAKGNPARSKDGVCIVEREYDAYGNSILIRTLDEQGVQSEGCFTRRATYDSAGMMTSQAVFAPDGSPKYEANGVHEYRFTRDAMGRTCGVRYYDTQGNPVYSPSDSCAEHRTVLDEQGRILELWKYDVQGELVFNRSAGSYGQRYTYDENGNRTRIEYLDADGNLVQSSNGYAVCITDYDDMGRAIREFYQDAQGNPVRCASGFAFVEIFYDTFGNYAGGQYYDENHVPCYHVSGYSSSEFSYEGGNLVSVAYFDTDGNPILCQRSYHKLCREFDEKGNPIRWFYYDTAGNLLETNSGYAIAEQDYDVYGNVTALRYFSAQMEPIPVNGYYAAAWEYDDRGNKVREELFSYAPDQLTYTVLEIEYDAAGNRIRDRYYDQYGNPVASETFGAIKEYTYDEKGNQVQVLLLDHTGSPLQADSADYENIQKQAFDSFGNKTLVQHLNRDKSGKEICLWQERYTYDAYGNCIREELLDGKGNLLPNDSGYAITVREYSPQGFLLAVEYYDDQQQPCFVDDLVFRYEYDRDSMGRAIQIRWYGTNRQLLKEADGYAAYSLFTYDAIGNRTSYTLLNEKGEPYGTQEDPTSYVEYFVDVMGQKVREDYYDKNGQLLYSFLPYTLISEVHSGSAAETAGLQVDDFLIELNGWNMFNLDTPSTIHDLQTTLASSVHREKELVVCYWDDNDQFHFRRLTLPEGATGFNVQSDVGDAEILGRMQNAYEAWLKENP